MKRDCVPLKRLAKVVAGQSPDSKDVLDFNGGIPFIQGNAEFGKIHPSPRLECAAPPKDAQYKDILVSVRAPVGAVNLADGPLGIGRGIAAVRPNHEDHTGFLYWSLVSSEQYLNSVATGSTFAAISGDDLGRLKVALPEDPTKVADYLNHETAEIDTFIEDQISLLKLLEEKTDAHITGITSQGLGNHSRFDEQWYPRLGTGWRVSPMKSVLLLLTDGAHISPVTENGTYPFVSTKDVKRGEIDTIGCLHTDAPSVEYMIRTGCRPESGDVLFSKDGTVGESAIVGSDLDFVVASSLVIIRPNPKLITSPFLRMALLTRPVREQARAFMKGAGLPRISVANVGRLIIPLPPLDEQHRIVEHLDEQILQADRLREDILQLVALARERRAALITAAVTGQIDVTARHKPAAEQLEDDIAQGLHREN